LLKYIEQNPLKAKIVTDIGKYKWSSSFCISNGVYKSLLKDSFLYDKALYGTLKKDITDKEMESLKRLENTKYKQGKQTTRLRQNSLEHYFEDVITKPQRDKQILKAVLDGYKQSEIADFLGLNKVKSLIF